MKKLDLMNKIIDSCALAVVRAPKERVVEIAEGIIKGGVPVMEVSFTNNDALDAIDAVHEKFGDKILVGAGTVLDETSARLAIMHDAGFLYSPAFDESVAKIANLYQVPYAAGCTSSTEALAALKGGATFIKMFPYSGIIGPNVIKTMKTPTPWMPMLESGAVNKDNINEWLDAGAEILGIGGALTKGSVNEIAESAKEIRIAINTWRNAK